MIATSRTLHTLVVVAGLLSPAAAAEPQAEPAPANATVDDLSDDAIFTQLFASRDFCKKLDAANAAAYDKGFEALTADSVAEAKAFMAKPDFAAIVAKGVANFEQRDKDPKAAGFGKGLCENYLKMQ